MKILPVVMFLASSMAIPPLYGQAGGPKDAADWPMYNRDPAGTRYSPLTQINRKNVGKLKLAWSYALKTDSDRPGALRASGSEVTPIVVGGVMYLPAAGRIVALHAETGKELWRYE